MKKLAASLVEAKSVMTSLYSLSLSKSRVGPEGMRHLCDAFAKGAVPALVALRLDENKLGDEGMKHLGAAIGRGALPSLSELNLKSNGIGAVGVRHLTKGLEAARKSRACALRLLYFGHNSGEALDALEDVSRNGMPFEVIMR